MTISAKKIRSPHTRFTCRKCGEAGQGKHVIALGKAVFGTKPFQIRLCFDCARTCGDPIVEKLFKENK